MQTGGVGMGPDGHTHPSGTWATQQPSSILSTGTQDGSVWWQDGGTAFLPPGQTAATAASG